MAQNKTNSSINIDSELWKLVKIKAIQSNKTTSEYIEDLLIKDIHG